jgi:hypothetical protein
MEDHEVPGATSSVTSPVTGRFDDDDVWRLPGSVVDCKVAGELVLVDAARGGATVLNRSAGSIVSLLDGRVTTGELIERLSVEHSVPIGTMRNHVRDLLATLAEDDLVVCTGDAGPGDANQGATARVDPAPAGPRPELGDRRTTFGDGTDGRHWSLVDTISIFDTTHRIRVEDEDVARLVAPLLESLRRTGEPAGDAAPRESELAVISDRPHGVSEHRLVVDGQLAAAAATGAEVTAQLCHRLDALAVDHSSDALLLHAGAVADERGAVVIAGSSGSGKSTLVTAFVQRGWSYLTDEVVAIGLDGRVRPYPKPVDLSPNALELLQLPDTGIDLGAAKRKLPPSTIGRTAEMASPDLVVVLGDPSPASADGGAIERLPPTAAFVALLPVAFRPMFEHADRLRRLAAWCERVAVVRVERSDPGQMVDAIRSARSRPDG